MHYEDVSSSIYPFRWRMELPEPVGAERGEEEFPGPVDKSNWWGWWNHCGNGVERWRREGVGDRGEERERERGGREGREV